MDWIEGNYARNNILKAPETIFRILRKSFQMGQSNALMTGIKESQPNASFWLPLLQEVLATARNLEPSCYWYKDRGVPFEKV